MWKRAVLSVAAIAAAVVYLGFEIETSVSMPDYAAVYMDNRSKTFIALPCISAWKAKTDAGFGFVHLAKAGDAWRLGYKPDHDCVEAGGYEEDGRSPSGMLLQKLGILPPITHWWDKPYRTENGIVYPHHN